MELALATTTWGLLGVIYLVLMLVLGITCLRKGHWVMFIIGIPIPLFWIIGAVIPPKQSS